MLSLSLAAAYIVNVDCIRYEGSHLCGGQRFELFQMLEEWGDSIQLSSGSKNQQAMEVQGFYMCNEIFHFWDWFP